MARVNIPTPNRQISMDNRFGWMMRSVITIPIITIYRKIRLTSFLIFFIYSPHLLNSKTFSILSGIGLFVKYFRKNFPVTTEPYLSQDTPFTALKSSSRMTFFLNASNHFLQALLYSSDAPATPLKFFFAKEASRSFTYFCATTCFL